MADDLPWVRDVDRTKLLKEPSGSPGVYLPRDVFEDMSVVTPTSGIEAVAAMRKEVRPDEVAGGSYDLTPRNMRITGPELLYLDQLAPLVHTPRAAKRLVNLYRLVKARMAAPDPDVFLDVDYRVVLVLLAVLVGRSGQCDVLFDAIESGRDRRQEMDRLVGELAVPDDLSAYRKWLPLVRRFSFTTAACA